MRQDFDFWSYVEGVMRGAQDIMDIVNEVRCKYCDSPKIAKHGEVNSVQRYRCNSCRRTFLDNENLPDMKTPAKVITSALNMYYEGLSLEAIGRHLDLVYGYHPSISTIYRWLVKYTREAVAHVEQHIPVVGKVWIADETVLKVGGENVWFWDLIDAKTRFLLASHISKTRTTKDALTLMKLAEARAGGKVPDLVFTDKLRAYLDGIELAWGADTKYIPSKGFVAPMNTNIIERFHGTLKDRTKVMRGLQNTDTARLFLRGWLVHYNYFRPHEALKGKTPAEMAGIRTTMKNWGSVVDGATDTDIAHKRLRTRDSPRKSSSRRRRRTAVRQTGVTVSGTKS